MTYEKLKEIIAINTNGHVEYYNVITAVDVYLSASNGAKLIEIGSFPSREDAQNEGKKRFKGRNHVLWKSNIFSAGAMWMLMKLTGISDVVGTDRQHPAPHPELNSNTI